MKFYRLTQTDPRYGMTGNVITSEMWYTLPYTDKPLYEAIDSTGKNFPYKVELSYSGKTPALYYLDDYEDLLNILHRIADRAGLRSERVPLYIPKSTIKFEFANYTINIIYRKEWETQDTSSSSRQGT